MSERQRRRAILILWPLSIASAWLTAVLVDTPYFGLLTLGTSLSVGGLGALLTEKYLEQGRSNGN